MWTNSIGEKEAQRKLNRIITGEAARQWETFFELHQRGEIEHYCRYKLFRKTEANGGSKFSGAGVVDLWKGFEDGAGQLIRIS